MRIFLYAALFLLIQASALRAEPDWGLLEEGATLLGKARSWVETCEAGQLGRLDGLLVNLRNVMSDAGLSSVDILRFDSILESARLLEGERIDCSDEEPRKKVGPAVDQITQAITP